MKRLSYQSPVVTVDTVITHTLLQSPGSTDPTPDLGIGQGNDMTADAPRRVRLF